MPSAGYAQARRELEIMMSVTQVKIRLSGGPAVLSAADLSVPADDLDRTLKISHLAGYEHFVHDGEYETVDGNEVAVFRWSQRTKIAE